MHRKNLKYSKRQQDKCQKKVVTLSICAHPCGYRPKQIASFCHTILNEKHFSLKHFSVATLEQESCMGGGDKLPSTQVLTTYPMDGHFIQTRPDKSALSLHSLAHRNLALVPVWLLLHMPPIQAPCQEKSSIVPNIPRDPSFYSQSNYYHHAFSLLSFDRKS